MLRSLDVLAVFTGRPKLIERDGREAVSTAIAKVKVTQPVLPLDTMNVDGDQQADRISHGGPDKAVYVYPSEHYSTWNEEGFDVASGGLGENVATAGATEEVVRIGDVWRWGTALVQVAQPRSPCYKLVLHVGRKDIATEMIRSGRTGWYLRVLEIGQVPTSGQMLLDARDDAAPTVAETFAAMFPELSEGHVLERVLGCRALADQWRSFLLKRRIGAAS